MVEEKDQIAMFLESSELFKDLTAEQLAHVVDYCTLEYLHDGDILIKENNDDRSDFFILCEGNLEIVSSNTDVLSEEVVLSKLEKHIFGELSWLSGKKRTATVRCHGEVEAIRINGRALTAYLEQNPDVGYPIMRRVAVLLSERLSGTDILLKQILWNLGI